MERVKRETRLAPLWPWLSCILQAQGFPHEHQLAEMTILVFSDMKEYLPEGYNRDRALPFDNTSELAMNITKPG